MISLAAPPPPSSRHPKRYRWRLAACLLVPLLQGCAVIAVADLAASAVVGTAGLAVDAAVGTARMGGKVIGKTVDVVTGSGAKP
jgi:hypothetical protein